MNHPEILINLVPSLIPDNCTSSFFLSLQTIPIAFALEYLPRTSNRTILQVRDKDRIWPVHCLVQARSVGFTSGWKDFVHDNHLKIGDICFFELLEIQEDILMTVYINRI